MKIQSISSYQNLKSPNFKAELKIDGNVFDAVGEKAAKRLSSVIVDFRSKLKAETLYPRDIVVLRKITGTPNSVYYESVPTAPGKWVSNGNYGQHFVPDTIRCGYGGNEVRPAPMVNTPRYKEEQLEVAINSSKCGFMFNDNCSDEQIVNDLMNTYRHVRSLEHK